MDGLYTADLEQPDKGNRSTDNRSVLNKKDFEDTNLKNMKDTFGLTRVQPVYKCNASSANAGDNAGDGEE